MLVQVNVAKSPSHSIQSLPKDPKRNQFVFPISILQRVDAWAKSLQHFWAASGLSYTSLTAPPQNQLGLFLDLQDSTQVSSLLQFMSALKVWEKDIPHRATEPSSKRTTDNTCHRHMAAFSHGVQLLIWQRISPRWGSFQGSSKKSQQLYRGPLYLINLTLQKTM